MLTGSLVLDCVTLEEAELIRDRVAHAIRDGGIDHVTLEVVSSTRAGAVEPACG